jgi:ATP-binding cassette, subfamily B, bacterial
MLQLLEGDRVRSTNRLHKLRDQCTILPRALGLVWTAAKGWTLAWIMLLMIQGVLPAATVFLTRQLVDSLVAATGSGAAWERLQPTLLFAALMAGVILLTELLKNALEWVHTAHVQYVQGYLYALIHDKASAIDLAFYETPEHFDRLHRAHKETSYRPVLLVENLGSLFQNGITLLCMGIILLPYGPWLPVLLVLSTFPALYVVLRFNRQYHHWWERTTSDWRRLDYYDSILTQSEFAAELRLFGLGPYFGAAYQTLRRRLRSEGLALTRNRVLGQLGAGAVGVLVFGSAMAWIGWRALQGLATLGDVALFYQAFDRGQNLMRAMLQNLGQIYSNSLFLGNLYEFLQLEPQIVDPPQPTSVPTTLQRGINFRQVTFRYPGSEKITLRDLNLVIPAGQIVAIVGANGAGKSTIIKLLCRFYDVEAGHIELDGIDIRDLSLRELRRQITVLFQTPAPYQATASENIALGDLEYTPVNGEIMAAAQDANARELIERLPRGYDTILGKRFASGTELSVGEWQRVALARAFFRKSQIVILDEPTSAMDSWAEAEWLARLRHLVKDQTAIIITHRFTTAMQADTIHVMNLGQIVESGTHAELTVLGGLYAQSWRAQMQAASTSEDRRLAEMAGTNGSEKSLINQP